MSASFREVQAQMASALLDPQGEIPLDLHSWNDSRIETRFAVYRNNVLSSLLDAIADITPVVKELVGDEFFRAMAAVFVRASPPRSPCLSRYADGFPDFIESFEPVRSVPYLADVARFELARLRSIHSADTPSIARNAWHNALSIGARPDQMKVRFHPSVRTLRSKYAVLPIWRAHHGEGDLSAIDIDRASHVLIWRETSEVRALDVDESSMCFIEMLMTGSTLSYAAQSVESPGRHFDLASGLRMLVGLNAVIEIILDERLES